MKEKTFRLCLTMAGAVSAGAYTAGVLDELFEVLDTWEKAKSTNVELGKDHPDYDKSIPMHRVEIEVLSGASAGGINAALSLKKILDTEGSGIEKNTILKECWVTMADTPDNDTLEQLLATDDLKKGSIPVSLLNGKPIDKLATQYFTPVNTPFRPLWVSENAELILTTTNLKGIPVNIHFEEAAPEKSGHTITQHSSVFRIRPAVKKKQNEPGNNAWYTLDLTSEKDMNYLREAALSTSAFPIGLPSREVSLRHRPYLKFPLLDKEHPNLNISVNDLSENQTFNSIDGGLLNNEPFGWCIRVLKEKCPKAWRDDRYAVIMIDPLPNKDTAPRPQNRHILGIASAMFRALRNEVMFDHEGLAEAISLRDRTRFLIAPRKGGGYPETLNNKGKVLASAPLSGFAGFLSKERRDHDYQLGRKNCRDFLRYHFTLSHKDTERRLLQTPTEEMSRRFGIYPGKKRSEGNLHYPIIPDMRIKYAREGVLRDPVKEAKEYPVLPEFDLDDFIERYQGPLTRRLSKLVTYTTGKWWIGLGFRLFFMRKFRKRFYQLTERELQFFDPEQPLHNNEREET